MIAVIQRVDRAAVSVDGEVVGKTGEGLMILLGVRTEDEEKDAELLAEKISKLRIFRDENGKLNLSVKDIGGGALVISNFTLMANYTHGNRPDYLNAARPEQALRLYEYFRDQLRERLPGTVETGQFGAHMEIDAKCNGPITIVMDSAVLRAGRNQ